MQGFDVYLLDWKSPARIDKYVSFDDYVNSYIDDCVEIVQNNNSSDKITLHGYCMGSSMSAMYTSLHQEKIQNLVTIAPVIDTSKDTTVIANISKQMDIDSAGILHRLPATRKALRMLLYFETVQAGS